MTEEACNHWARPEQRVVLALHFDHRIMSNSSARCAGEYEKSSTGSQESLLYSVAHTFRQLQNKRRQADYDLSNLYSDEEVADVILLASNAFDSWALVRREQIAQDYLFALLFKPRA